MNRDVERKEENLPADVGKKTGKKGPYARGRGKKFNCLTRPKLEGVIERVYSPQKKNGGRVRTG